MPRDLQVLQWLGVNILFYRPFKIYISVELHTGGSDLVVLLLVLHKGGSDLMVLLLKKRKLTLYCQWSIALTYFEVRMHQLSRCAYGSRERSCGKKKKRAHLPSSCFRSLSQYTFPGSAVLGSLADAYQTPCWTSPRWSETDCRTSRTAEQLQRSSRCTPAEEHLKSVQILQYKFDHSLTHIYIYIYIYTNVCLYTSIARIVFLLFGKRSGEGRRKHVTVQQPDKSATTAGDKMSEKFSLVGDIYHKHLQYFEAKLFARLVEPFMNRVLSYIF